MPKFEVVVHLMKKPGCLEPEEPVVLSALHRLDFNAIQGIRVGKCHILSIEAEDDPGARSIAVDACKKLLANLVTDTFEIFSIKQM